MLANHIVYTNPLDLRLSGVGRGGGGDAGEVLPGLAQKTDVREYRLCRTLTIAEVHRVALVALATLVQANQQLQNVVAIGHAQVALIDLVAATHTKTTL